MAKRPTLLTNVLQSVLVAVALAALGAAFKIYMDVHDLNLTVHEYKDKMDWLFRHLFPHMP